MIADTLDQNADLHDMVIKGKKPENRGLYRSSLCHTYDSLMEIPGLCEGCVGKQPDKQIDLYSCLCYNSAMVFGAKVI